MSDIQPARGFRDFLPKLKTQKEHLLARIRATYQQYGFQEIETPVVEPLERLRNSDGGENTGLIFQILERGLKKKDLQASADLQRSLALEDPEASAALGDLCDLGLRYD